MNQGGSNVLVVDQHQYITFFGKNVLDTHIDGNLKKIEILEIFIILRKTF